MQPAAFAEKPLSLRASPIISTRESGTVGDCDATDALETD
jgi:hypothetical protein